MSRVKIIPGKDVDSPPPSGEMLKQFKTARRGVVPRPRKRGQRGPGKTPSKEVRLEVRVTQEFALETERAAEKLGLSRSAFIRQAVAKETKLLIE